MRKTGWRKNVKLYPRFHISSLQAHDNVPSRLRCRVTNPTVIVEEEECRLYYEDATQGSGEARAIRG